MVISSSNNYSKDNLDVLHINNSNKKDFKRFKQNGQIQIYQSSYRGSYSSIIRDSLRNAALGRKVLLVQFMKGGVKQGIANAIKLCGNLTWIRSSHSFDQYHSEEIESQYNLIKMLLAEPEKYREAINAIKKDIAYMPIELKKKLEEENIIL